MSDIADRLLVLAGAKKPTQKKLKFSGKVENAWQEAYDYVHSTMGKGTSDRMFRLMKRIRYALESEGYNFQNHDNHADHLPGQSRPYSKTPPKFSDGSYVVCNGSVCTLIHTKPPKGLGIDACIRLGELFRSKQCYSFKVKPKDKSKLRKRGKNICLPKPCTWHRLNQRGAEVESIMDGDNNHLMESVRVDGITAYTLDRETFYIPNPEMCRRWMAGLDSMIAEQLDR